MPSFAETFIDVICLNNSLSLDVWVKLGGSVHDETETTAPHYHLRF